MVGSGELWIHKNELHKVVSERLGRASIILTLDTYSHVLPDMQQAATEKLAEVFGSGVAWGQISITETTGA